MKKYLILTLTAVFLLFGCSNSKDVATKFEFEIRSQTIVIGSEVKNAIQNIGTPLTQFSSPSCAFTGDDTVYDYGSYQITTYDANGTEIFTGVYIMDTSISTKEGVKIGDLLEDMKRVYGEDYVENYGAYTYTSGRTDLSFVIVNNVITSISYLHIVE